MHESPYSPSDPAQEKIEKRDVHFASVLISLGGLTFFIVGSIVAGFVVYKGLEFYIKKCDRPAACMFEAKVQVPEPRLQVTPAQDLIQVKSEQQKIVEGYAVLDAGAGTARIPVSRAIEMIADKPDIFLRKKEEPEEVKLEEKKQEAVLHL